MDKSFRVNFEARPYWKVEKMSRISSHAVETKAVDSVRSKINSHYENGDALFRELTERDYGIDAVIELFNDGEPTGQFALIQIKGTQNAIIPLRQSECVSCRISSSNAKYSLQSNIPVFLIYLTVNKPDGFYYINLQGVFKGKKLSRQKNITIHIPIKSNYLEDIEPLFEEIRQFYKKKL